MVDHAPIATRTTQMVDHATIATRATQMVETLSHENQALRDELQAQYKKISKLHKVRYTFCTPRGQ